MEIKAERLIAAVPVRVERALTSPAELTRWSCQQAEVTQQTYRLTGSSLPLGALGGRVLTRSEQSLQFEWVLAGQPTIVTVSWEGVPQPGNPPATFTRVVVEHNAIPADAIDSRFPKELWECIWTYWLRLLRGWVERVEVLGDFAFTGTFTNEVERHLVMQAPSEKVWRAISDPELRKRWFPEEIGEVLTVEEGRCFAFRWPEKQNWPPSVVTFVLEPAGDNSTRVTIRETGLTWSTIDHHIGWYDYLVALYQETALPLIRKEQWIKAAPEKVWSFLSSQEGMRRWFNKEMTFEPFVGGAVHFEAYGGTLGGKVLALEPNRRLAFSWTDYDEEPTKENPLLLTIELEADGSGTRVTLTHSGFEKLPLSTFGGYQRGWAGDWVSLKNAVEAAEQVA